MIVRFGGYDRKKLEGEPLKNETIYFREIASSPATAPFCMAYRNDPTYSLMVYF